MAKEIKQRGVDKPITHLDEGELAEEQEFGAGNQEADPLTQIALALSVVAKGASVIELRKVVVENAPADMEERKKYVAQLRRLRDAADTALTLGYELASGV
jgi:hypothetical protein